MFLVIKILDKSENKFIMVAMAYFLKPIYIDKTEGIGSIISRLENTTDSQIALVFPPDSFIFKNVLEIQYLQRETIRLKKDIVIITPDKGQEELAKSFGLKVKADLFEEGEKDKFLEGFYKKDDQTPLTKIEVQNIELEPPQKETQYTREPSQKESKSNNLSNLTKNVSSKIPKVNIKGFGGYLYLLMFISFLVFVYVISSVLLSAEVTIKPKKEKLSLQETVKFMIDMPADSTKNILPLEVFTVTKEKSSQFNSTGEKEGSFKSTGTVTLYNNYSKDPQTLVQKTRLLSKDNKIFRLTKKVNIPGYKEVSGKTIPGNITVTVEADEPGDTYNIAPTTFTIPGFKGLTQHTKFWAESTTNMQGGKTGKTKFVTSDDLSNAKNKILALIKQEVNQDLGTSFPKEYDFFPEIDFKDTQVSPDVQINDTKDVFNYKIKATALIFGYKKDALTQFIGDKLKNELTKNKIILKNKGTLAFTNAKVSQDFKELDALMQAQPIISYNFDQSWLKDILAGKNEKDILAFKNGYPEIETLEISIKPAIPFINSQIPKDKNKIKINIDYGD